MWLLTTLALVQVQPPGPFDLQPSGCSSGGERLLGMQEAAGAIPVIQTDRRASSLVHATAPRWNAELLPPAAGVRVLSVVPRFRHWSVGGRRQDRRSGEVRFLSVARFHVRVSSRVGPIGDRRRRSLTRFDSARDATTRTQSLGRGSIPLDGHDARTRSNFLGVAQQQQRVAHSYEVTGAIPVAQTNDSWM